MTLVATTLLGDNTVDRLQTLVSELSAAGVDVAFDESALPSERVAAAAAGEVDVLFACGLLTVELIDQGCPFSVVASHVFPGETNPVYRSVIVVRQDAGYAAVPDALVGRLVVNEYESWSGWQAYRRHLRERGLAVEAHPEISLSGGHVRSVAAVTDGAADVAAIDSSIWHALPATARAPLRVLDATRDWPAPPLSLHARVPERDRSTIGSVLAVSGVWRPAHDHDYRVMQAP